MTRLRSIDLPRPLRAIPVLASALALWLCVAPATAQERPCAGLSAEEAQAYTDLAYAAVEAYQQQDYATSIEKNLAALKLCFEDPNLYYNLARAYHQAGDCHMALFTYEEIDLAGLEPGKRSNVEEYMAELMPQCGDSAVVLITCEDSAVQLEFAGRTTSCPWSGRLEPGEHEIVASLSEHRPWLGTLRVVAGGENTFDVPGLMREDQFGRLAVTCGEGVQDFTVVYADGTEETLSCPWEGELEIGTYTLRTDPQGEPLSATVVSQTTTNIDALSTPPPSSCACQVRRSGGPAPLGTAAALVLLGLGLVVTVRRRQRVVRDS